MEEKNKNLEASLSFIQKKKERKKEQEKEERLIKCKKLKENFILMKLCIDYIEENSSLWERGKTETDGKKKEETPPIPEFAPKASKA